MEKELVDNTSVWACIMVRQASTGDPSNWNRMFRVDCWVSKSFHPSGMEIRSDTIVTTGVMLLEDEALT
jgi:hypothetical protein